MKRSFTAFVFVFAAIVCTLPQTTFADDPKARAIMEKIDARDDGDNQTADMEMVLIDKKGQKRVRKIHTFSKDQGKDTIKDMAITKLFVTQTAVDVCRWGMQVHGAYGISKEYKIERLYRDAKMYELLEGTSEIQRELIVKRLPR